MTRTPFHVVAGFLGTGKTTAIRHLVAARAGTERAAVVVNDIGDAAIDATVLGDRVTVTNIPGGCVCCTAPEGLVDAVRLLLDTMAPDRIYIEPSGLANPADVVDMLARGPLASRLDRRPVVVLLDPGSAPDAERLARLLEPADYVVLNRVDLATDAQLAAVRTAIAGRWPAPVGIYETTHGVLPFAVLAWPPGTGPDAASPGTGPDAASHDHDHDHDHENTAAHGGAAGVPSTAGYHARSWVFPPDRLLQFDALRALAEDAGIVRLKGLFRTDLGWFRVDRAGGRVHVLPTSWRRDSRLDVIVTDAARLPAVDEALRAAGEPGQVPADGVRLESAAGDVWVLDPTRLGALDGQVSDVGAVVPGRVGSGVWLKDVLALAAPRAGARFVVSAADGMTTPPAPVAEAGEAVLLYRLGAEPLPATQGGPYRLLGPTEAGRTACANVKGVARIRILPNDG